AVPLLLGVSATSSNQTDFVYEERSKRAAMAAVRQARGSTFDANAAILTAVKLAYEHGTSLNAH
ncbi:hypothetical protein, partial [Streptomyces sp. Ncost-T10-10d]|uniref:hypothetical protein n=1 Tax=Streptomyces sp. Ncost-T10-10d TaxID=1839774 RepID=UPI001C4015C3